MESLTVYCSERLPVHQTRCCQRSGRVHACVCLHAGQEGVCLHGCLTANTCAEQTSGGWDGAHRDWGPARDTPCAEWALMGVRVGQPGRGDLQAGSRWLRSRGDILVSDVALKPIVFAARIRLPSCFLCLLGLAFFEPDMRMEWFENRLKLLQGLCLATLWSAAGDAETEQPGEGAFDPLWGENLPGLLDCASSKPPVPKPLVCAICRGRTNFWVPVLRTLA